MSQKKNRYALKAGFVVLMVAAIRSAIFWNVEGRSLLFWYKFINASDQPVVSTYRQTIRAADCPDECVNIHQITRRHIPEVSTIREERNLFLCVIKHTTETYNTENF